MAYPCLRMTQRSVIHNRTDNRKNQPLSFALCYSDYTRKLYRVQWLRPARPLGRGPGCILIETLSEFLIDVRT